MYDSRIRPPFDSENAPRNEQNGPRIEALALFRHLIPATPLRLLAEHEDIIIVAECANGKESAALLLRESPDLVFLDI